MILDQIDLVSRRLRRLFRRPGPRLPGAARAVRFWTWGGLAALILIVLAVKHQAHWKYPAMLSAIQLGSGASATATSEYPDSLLQNHYWFIWQIQSGLEDPFSYVAGIRWINHEVEKRWREFESARSGVHLIVPLTVKQFYPPDDVTVDSLRAWAVRVDRKWHPR